MAKKLYKQKEKKQVAAVPYVAVDCFVWVTLAVLPLAVWNRYNDILEVKYWLFCGAVLAMLLCLVGYGIVTRTAMGALNRLRKDLHLSDAALLIFLATAIISTLSSEYLYEAFWGNEGRYTGLFLLLLYGSAYFSVTRCGSYKNWYLDWLLLAGVLVCVFGITDYFQLDILKFKVGMRPVDRSSFTSTMGNINTYTAYVGMLSAVSMILFALSKGRRMILYYMVMLISFLAIIMGTSDNAYLALAALFGFSPLYLFGTKQGVSRYLISVATFFSVILSIDWIHIWFKEYVIENGGAFFAVAGYRGLPYIVIFLWVMAAAFCWYRSKSENKSSDKEGMIGNGLRYVWLAFCVLIVLGIIYLLYDCNINGNIERYAGFRNYLYFDDSWGTRRGFVWRVALEEFQQFSLWKKLFGFGPDTFGILLSIKGIRDFEGTANIVYDNTHNEYLQYLLTVGMVGLTAYVTFLVSAVTGMFKRSKGKPYCVAAAFAVICYGAQALVNLNLPIATPIMWLLLMVGMMKNEEKS